MPQQPSHPGRFHVCVPILAVASLLIGSNAAGSPSATGKRWSTTTALSVRAAMDDNVHLQDVTALAGRESFVSTVSPALGFTFDNDRQFKATGSYAPDVVRFHSVSSESHVAHRGSLNFTGKTGGVAWEFLNSVQLIDGSNEGPRFLVGGDIPAAGGIPLRDRRDALIHRGSLRATKTGEAWMVRAQLSRYDHDFRTRQLARAGANAGYENYIDRAETMLGVDVGRRRSAEGVWLVAGYRFGHQWQGPCLGVRSPYSHTFHRVLTGVEGTLGKWVKVSVLAGPDFREFDPNPNPIFHGSEILYFVDASMTVTLTERDTVTLTARRFEQPGFASHSVYEDGTYEMTWRRKFGAKLSVGAGLKTYIADFQAPANREDWIITPSITMTYAVSRTLTIDGGYLRDHASSKVPGTAARDYTRQLVSAGVRYTF